MKKFNTPTDVFPGQKLKPGGLIPAITKVGHHLFLPYIFKVTAVLEKAVGDFINEAIKFLKPSFLNLIKFKSAALNIRCNTEIFCLNYTLK